MTQLEIKDERTKLTDYNDALFAQVKAEGRNMTADEKAKVQENLRKMEDLNIMEASNDLKGADGKPASAFKDVHYIKPVKFSLLKTVRDLANGGKMDGAATDLTILGRQEFRTAGVNPQGSIILPSYYEKRAGDITAGDATQGAEIVQEDKKAILPPLVDKLVFSKAGALFMPGLVGDVSIPTYAGTTVAWKGENAAADDGSGAFSEVTFSPKRLTGYLTVSKTFLAQDGIGAERLLLDNIANAVARKLEATILGKEDLGPTVPQGIGFKLDGTAELDVSDGTITWATVVGLETAVDVSNALQGNLAYMTNSTGRGMLKTIDKGLSNDTGDFLMSEDNMINGYLCYVTNSIGAAYGSGDGGNMLVFGNWGDLMIGQWGGYDITVDPYTAAKTNQVIIVINAYFDAKGLRAVMAGDHYAKSFAALSIKA